MILNDKTIKDSYPIPNTNDCFDSLSGAKLFRTMDIYIYICFVLKVQRYEKKKVKKVVRSMIN